MSKMNNIITHYLRKILFLFLLLLIALYQTLISPLLIKSCRFYPSCSEYAKLALKNLPLTSAIFAIIKRLLSCHPFSRKPYYNPVPLSRLNPKDSNEL